MSHPYPLAAEHLLHQNYRIVRILGSGGFGITYLTEHVRLGNRFVIKEYFPSELAKRLSEQSEVLPHSTQRELFESGMRYFFREARLLNQFKHPNIIPVTDLFEANGTAYFVMPYIGGNTLSEYLHRHPQPDCAELSKIFLPLLDALEFLHNQNILHRDIKPQNVLLADNTPILIDFGTAKDFSAGPNTQSSLLFISQGYSPLEQYTPGSELSPAADLYAFSACLYRAVTGKQPPPATGRIGYDPAVLADNSDCRVRYPQAWLQVIDKGFAVMETQRYQSSTEMRQAWQAALAGNGAKAELHAIGLLTPDEREILSSYVQAKDGDTQARKRLQELAEHGYALAQFNLGFIYRFGEGVERDEQQALKWFRKAAEQGDATAQFNLGMMYDYGHGVEKDYQQAAEWYLKAAEQGCERAQIFLGEMYENGDGVEKNYQQAVKWYLKAAEQGSAEAQFALGTMYYNGNGVGQDYQQAAEWYLKAAERGDEKAQYNLAWMYEKGYGVEQDYQQAVFWYRKSAEQGVARAQTSLGWMYQYGDGVGQDYQQAAAWFLKAAEQGDTPAQFSLGFMYEKGNGVVRDRKRAAYWYGQAAEQGNEGAQRALDRLQAEPQPRQRSFLDKLEDMFD